MRLGRMNLEFNNEVTTINLVEKIKEKHGLYDSYNLSIKSIKVEIIKPSSSIEVENGYAYWLIATIDGQECQVYDRHIHDHDLKFDNVEIESCIFENRNGSIETFTVDYTF